MTTTTPTAIPTTSTPTFDLHRTADWLARQDPSELDAHHDDLVTAVDAVAAAAGAPAALRPADTDPTPALVRLFNHHAATLHRHGRPAAGAPHLADA